MSTVFRVEHNTNYTVMANYHLKDRRLTYKAKGLLSEMLSLPPDWDFTLTGLAVIAVDGVDSVRSAVHELEKFGYLVRRQRRDERGRMSVSEYTVFENPEQNPNYLSNYSGDGKSDCVESVESAENSTVKPNSPSLENPVSDGNSEKNQFFLTKSVSGSPTPTAPTSENPTSATYYNKLNKQELNTHQSNHSINRAQAREDGIDVIDFSMVQNERNFFRDIVRERIEYDYYAEASKEPRSGINLAKIDEIVELMVDVICSRKPTIRVNGENLPQKLVKQRFLSLKQPHIDYVLTALKNNYSEVRNIRAYLITALYNAPQTIESYYDAEFNHDMYGT